MTLETQYQYSVLRYEHDVRTEEFLNIAVLLWSPSESRVFFKFPDKFTRLSAAFPGVDSDGLSKLLKDVGIHLRSIRPAESRDLFSVANRVIPRDDSAFKWSEPSSGLTPDINKTLEEIFEELITKYDRKNEKHLRTDRDIWSDLEVRLRAYHVLHRIQKVKLRSPLREYNFEHGWMDSFPRAIAPISLDGSNEQVAGKATHWAGQLADLKRSSDEFHIKMIVGEPTEHGSHTRFSEAFEFLRASSDDPRLSITLETGKGDLAASLAKEIDPGSV